MIKWFRTLPKGIRTMIILIICLAIPSGVALAYFENGVGHTTDAEGNKQYIIDGRTYSMGESNVTKYQKLGIQTPADLMIRFPYERVKKVEQETGYDVIYNEYLPSRYTLELIYEDKNWWEMDEKISNTGHFFSHGTTNAIWGELVQLAFTVIDFTIDVWELDVVDKFSDQIATGIREYAGFDSAGNMKADGLWGYLLTGVIFMVGAWGVFVGMLMRKTTKLWQGLLGSFGVMVLFIGFYLNAGGVLDAMNDGSKQLSLQALKASQSLLTDKEVTPEAYPYVLADHIHYMEILVPYTALQHNGIPESTVVPKAKAVYRDLPAGQRQVFDEEIRNAEKKRREAQLKQQEGKVTWDRIQQILEHPLGSKERIQAVKDERDEYQNKLVTTLGTQERLKSMGLLAILLCLQSIVFLVIDLGAQVFQILFILLTLMAPIVGLVAIFPPVQNLAKKWFELWFFSLLTKVMFTVVLSIIFFTSNLMYKIVPPEQGLHKAFLWQILILLCVIIFRKQLFGMLIKPTTNVHVRMGRGAISRGRQAVRHIRRATRSGGRSGSKGGEAA